MREWRTNRNFLIAGILVLFSVGTTLLYCLRPDKSRYDIMPIENIGIRWSHATAINERGWVAGTFAAKGTPRTPFFWTPDLGMKSLGTHQGGSGWIRDMNDQGHVVGHFSFQQGKEPTEYHGFLWTEEGNLTHLTPSTSTESNVAGIKNDGSIAGLIFHGTRSQFAEWDLDGSCYPLEEEIHSASEFFIHAINELGYGVGNYERGNQQVAVLWEVGGVVQDIGTLDGDYSHALDLNDEMQVVGFGESASHTQIAFLWEDDRMVALETPANGSSSRAHSINNKGQVVGCVYHPTDTVWGVLEMAYRKARNKEHTLYNDNEHAVLWEEGKLHYLNDLIPRDSGWELLSAEDINDSGQIVGGGLIHGVERGFLMTPLDGAN